MNPIEWLTAPLFSVFDKNFTPAQVLGAAFGLVVAVYFYRKIFQKPLAASVPAYTPSSLISTGQFFK